MNLLEGKSPVGSEEDLGLVTQPYPGWDNKAKETLNRIPTKGQNQNSPAPTATTPAAASLPVSDINVSVTHEQSAVTNPAAPETTPTSSANAAEPLPPPAPIVKPPVASAKAASSPAANAPAVGLPVASTPSSAVSPALVHPTHEHPLAVGGAEQTPAAPPTPVGEKKKEPTPAERLAALIKQRSEFLTALKAEVTRRRNATEDDDELVRLEKELRLVQLAGEHPEEAVQQIEKLDATEKEAFAHLLMGLATWMSTDEARRPTLRNAKIVREIRDAAAELAAASKLDVRNLAFCEKVESYGWYNEFAKNQFKPKQQVILYAEVENFSAIRIADESFETELQGSYQIFDSRGGLVDERELPLDKEVCRNCRRDYFLAYLIYLPDGIVPGSYRLELTIEDKKASATQQEPNVRRGENNDKLGKLALPSSASSYKGRKLGTGTIEFSIK